MNASRLTNSGAVSGINNVGELIGYFDADMESTVTTYTIREASLGTDSSLRENTR